MPSRSIHNELKLTRNVKAVMKNLYSIVQQMIKRELNGKSPVEVMIIVFRDEAYETLLGLDDDGRATH